MTIVYRGQKKLGSEIIFDNQPWHYCLVVRVLLRITTNISTYFLILVRLNLLLLQVQNSKAELLFLLSLTVSLRTVIFDSTF